MSLPSDPATGVKVFSIGGRMVHVRERCMGMTDQERQWRAQFLKDQILSENEPRDVPEYYKATTNIFRRLWRTPMWKFQTFLVPMLGKENAYYVRHFIGKTSCVISFMFIAVYYFKYHANDWTRNGGWYIFRVRPRMYPDHPDYPNFHVKVPYEYLDFGYESSPYYKTNKKA